MAKKSSPKKITKTKKNTNIKSNKVKLDEQLNKLEDSLKNEKEKYLRLFAEFENFKKRTAKERIDLYKTANQEVISSLIPVLDDFNRANAEMNKKEGILDKEGVRLIYNKFNDVLKNNGLNKTEVKIGDLFDAEIHEAITQIPAQKEKDKGKIFDIIEVGYQLGEKIIRYPKVVVGQ
mgnify:CR=1 FL=1